MIPSINNILTTDLEVSTQPSHTYRMYPDDKYINGTCDNLEAVKQAVYKILNSERYKYIIYSRNYGVEFSDFVGQPTSYVCSELQRRITEALIQDDRIESVSDFEFDTSKRHELVCTFTVHTIFGDISEEKVVSVNV